MTSETDGEANTTAHTHDGNGNRLTSQRPNGNTWRYAYDGADRLVSLTDPLNGVTAYGYDNNSNRTSQSDANNNATSHVYDALNRLTTTTYANSASETAGYDENGNRTRFTDAMGQVFNYTYDALNRETQRDYPPPATPTGDDLQQIATTYDANGNPLTLSETRASGARTTTNRYDRFDRLIETTDGFGKTLGYTYDANGNRTSLSDPDSKVSRYSFDALNRLSTVHNATGITNYGYDRSSLLSNISYPNGADADYSYDNARRVTRVVNSVNSAVASQYVYTYDSNGNRLSQQETNGGANEITGYTYDNNDRLTRADYPDATVDYGYDAAYNRTRETTVEKATGTTVANKSFSYNNRNQVTGITDSANAANNTTYTYDANGNQTLKTQNGHTLTFVYDVSDRLVRVSQDATTLGQFRYDHAGMRIQKEGAQGVVRYTYDDGSVLIQTDDAGATLAKYDYGPDRLLSLEQVTEGNQFYHFDALGSVVNLSKPDGSLQARYQYDAWGNERASTGSSWNRFAFTGHEKDEETGLYYFKARFYDPLLGRFLSQDGYLGETNTPPSLHRYLYAYANPTVYIDLTGYASEEEREAARKYVAEQRRQHEQQIREQNKVSEEIAQLNKERIASGEYMTPAEAAERETRRKVEEEQKAKIAQESEHKPGTDEGVIEQIRQDRERTRRAFKAVGEGFATVSEVGDALAPHEVTDFIPGAAIVGAIKGGKKVYNVLSRNKSRDVTKKTPSGGSPALKGDPYHPDSVSARQKDWQKAYGDFDPKAVAADLGYGKRIPPQKAPFNSHGQPVFSNGKGYISPDIDGHNVTNGWKMFDKKGRRTGTWNSDLSKRLKD